MADAGWFLETNSVYRFIIILFSLFYSSSLMTCIAMELLPTTLQSCQVPSLCGTAATWPSSKNAWQALLLLINGSVCLLLIFILIKKPLSSSCNLKLTRMLTLPFDIQIN